MSTSRTGASPDGAASSVANGRLATAGRLVRVYVALALLTVVALAVLSIADPDLVTPQAWVRGVIVAGLSFLTLSFAHRAERGEARGLLRLRIVVLVLLVAFVAVLFLLPLPGWLVVEQAVSAVLLLVVTILLLPRRSSVDG